MCIRDRPTVTAAWRTPSTSHLLGSAAATPPRSENALRGRARSGRPVQPATKDPGNVRSGCE
eukprot:14947833-Alexandrium_andersonii.AAC.1